MNQREQLKKQLEEAGILQMVRKNIKENPSRGKDILNILVEESLATDIKMSETILSATADFFQENFLGKTNVKDIFSNKEISFEKERNNIYFQIETLPGDSDFLYTKEMVITKRGEEQEFLGFIPDNEIHEYFKYNGDIAGAVAKFIGVLEDFEAEQTVLDFPFVKKLAHIPKRSEMMFDELFDIVFDAEHLNEFYTIMDFFATLTIDNDTPEWKKEIRERAARCCENFKKAACDMLP